MAVEFDVNAALWTSLVLVDSTGRQHCPSPLETRYYRYGSNILKTPCEVISGLTVQ